MPRHAVCRYEEVPDALRLVFFSACFRHLQPTVAIGSARAHSSFMYESVVHHDRDYDLESIPCAVNSTRETFLYICLPPPTVFSVANTVTARLNYCRQQ